MIPIKWLQPAVAVLCLALIASGSWVYYQAERRRLQDRVQDALIAIADAKLRQIEDWRDERLDDARFFSQAPFVARDVTAFLAAPDSAVARTNLFAWLRGLAPGTRYAQAIVFDAARNARFSVPAMTNAPGPTLQASVADVLQRQTVVLTDPRRRDHTQEIRLDLLFPVFAPAESFPRDGPAIRSNAPIAVIALRIDPQAFLYPLLRAWPVPSQSGEAALARREGNRVVFLSDVRFRSNSALNLTFPVDQPDLPAALAARGRQGVVEGRDYRGVPVLTVFRPVPDTPWLLGAKVDQSEILAPSRAKTFEIAAAALALALAVLGGLGWFWRKREADFLRAEVAAQGALRASEAKYRSLFENSRDGIVFMDAGGKVVEASRSYADLLGYSAAEVLDLHVWDWDAQWTRDDLLEMIRTIPQAGLPLETRHRRKDGSCLDVEISSNAIELGGQKLVFCVCRDVSQRKRLAQERAAMEAQLRQQQKLESIGTLAGGVAHEINNPLTGIMNYAQLIQDRLPAGSPLTEFTGEILHETERVATIVRNLLAFARNEKQSHSPARMADIIEGTLSLIRTVIRRDQITLHVNVPPDLPTLNCRSQQLQQVLMNLMTNARDALNARYPGPHADKVLRVAAGVMDHAGRRWLRLTVEDCGTGIPPAVRERMFDPFFTTKARDQGTGLGLSISHGIVKEHGGRWTVETEPGCFTRMHVDLPVAPEETP